MKKMARNLVQRIELATDRGRCGPAISELARRMQQPNTKNMQALKRLVRLVVYNRQAEPPIVDVFSDSDWPGCAKTRRSTSSSYVMPGGHLLAASATTQNVATSSGEAEFHASLGAVAMAADMAKVVKLRVRVDATASKAIASRRGVGRVRHLHTQVLWVQEAVARPELTIVKVPEVENPADMGMKHFAQKEMHECLRRAGYHITGGAVEDGVSSRTRDLSQAALGATETETEMET